MSPNNNGLIFRNGHWDRTNPALKHFTPVRLARWCINVLRPAILTRGPRKQLISTSYLDGLRGFAAFLVYWSHHQGWPRGTTDANQIFESGFGYEGKYYFACLPGIRHFFSGGHFAVAVFFVISGHVLSTKPLAMIHAGNHDKLGENLASALFRRWLRLYIPVICTTFLYMTSWHALGLYTGYPDHQSTYRDELSTWYKEFKQFSFVFKSPEKGEYIPWFSYNFHLWSIPFEFRGSILVYTALSAFSRCRRNARLCCEIALIFYFIYIARDGCLYAMFMSGVFLCDLDMLARNKDLPGFFSRLEPYKEAAFYTLFAMSVYLSAVPVHNADFNALRATPGWYYLSFLKPDSMWDPKWFYFFWAGIFLVASIPRLPWLKSFFELRFCQYLGKISFSLYLVHGPVLWTLGDRIYLAVGWSRDNHVDGVLDWMNIYPLPKWGPLGLEPAFLLPQLVLLPFTLWLSEISTKLFDEPSIRFPQWLYRRALATLPES